MKLHSTYVIKRPLITEKSSWESEVRNRVSFEVHKEASKPQIKKAIEELYSVRVESVATMTRKGKYKRTRWGTTKTPDWKKATVQIHEDDRIDLF
ncbi:MAG: 50S ribosomal protein L23 [Planctomycetota bacterium]